MQKPVDAQRIIDEAARAAGEVASAAGSAAASTVSGFFDFASAATRHVPGFGVLRAFGHLGMALSRSALATAQDVTKALADFGVEHDLARRYSEALRSGSILVIVDAKTDNIARCAQQVMTTHGATTPEARAAH